MQWYPPRYRAKLTQLTSWQNHCNRSFTASFYPAWHTVPLSTITRYGENRHKLHPSLVWHKVEIKGGAVDGHRYCVGIENWNQVTIYRCWNSLCPEYQPRVEYQQGELFCWFISVKGYSWSNCRCSGTGEHHVFQQKQSCCNTAERSQTNSRRLLRVLDNYFRFSPIVLPQVIVSTEQAMTSHIIGLNESHVKRLSKERVKSPRDQCASKGEHGNDKPPPEKCRTQKLLIETKRVNFLKCVTTMKFQRKFWKETQHQKTNIAWCNDVEKQRKQLSKLALLFVDSSHNCWQCFATWIVLLNAEG